MNRLLVLYDDLSHNQDSIYHNKMRLVNFSYWPICNTCILSGNMSSVTVLNVHRFIAISFAEITKMKVCCVFFTFIDVRNTSNKF